MNTTINTAIALMKRETWEHRGFWMVPGIMAALMFLAFAWGMLYIIPTEIGVSAWVFKMIDSDADALGNVGAHMMPAVAAPFFFMMAIVTTFYLLDSLYSERRDRSILFWKSLPVTDTATVMSKWLAALVVFPAIVIATVVLLSLLMAIVTSVMILIGGGSPWELVWQHFSFFGGIGNIVLAFVIEALWYLPWMGWLLLASAWAKKAPFLWAVLPIGAVTVVEAMLFETTRFISFIGHRLAPFGADIIGQSDPESLRLFGGDVRLGSQLMNFDYLTSLLASAGFWGGLVFAAACTVGAIWLRRYRDES